MTVSKTFLRKSFLLGARYSGLAPLAGTMLRGVGAILMLHRLGPCTNGLCINGFLSVQPDFLDRMLGTLKRDGYVFCAMDEAIDRIKAGHKDELFLSVTLDDGYKDNMTAARPVFEAHNVPYTIFITPGFVEGYAHLWWENLSQIVEKQSRISFATADGVASLDCATSAEKRAAYDELLNYLTSRVDEPTQREFVDQLCRAYGVDPKAYVRDQVMSWDELREINLSPLCSLGAHTLNHYHLARLSREDAAFEMEQSAQVLEVELGERPKHFAYPYGGPIAVGSREVEIAREIGFESSVTTRHGLLHADHANTLHSLPRISVNGNYQRMNYMRTLLSGIAVPLANKGRRVVTV